MSKFAAVDTAVRLQLALDGRAVDYGKRYGQVPQGGIATDWVVVPEEDMAKFLLAVATRLKGDTPPLIFAWRKLEPGKIFGNRLAMIVSMIEDLTDGTKNP